MTVLCILKIFLISLCMQFDLIPLINCTAGIDHTLSKQDVLLIKDTENPKCFTRTLKDFTCFFETTENRTYDFLYKCERGGTKKCEMSIYGTDNGTFLHVCFFPWMDIFLFTETKIEVVDRTKNTSLYNRTVSVEDLCLLEPPFNVSLQPNDNVGKLSVFLDTVKLSPIRPKEYRIRYSSVTLGEKTVEVRKNSFQLPVVPGEEVEVQASVKCVSDSKTHPGHWSAWSKPVVATVPKSAGTTDLTATATGGSIDNRRGEHSPLGHYVSNLPRNLVKALLEVGVEYIPDRGFRQTFPTDSHYMFGPAKSVRLSPLPADPTHHQVVISGQLSPSPHPSVQNMHADAEREEEFTLTETTPTSPSPGSYSPARSVQSVDVSSASSPTAALSPEYTGVTTSTVTTAGGSTPEAGQQLSCMRSNAPVPPPSSTHRMPVYAHREEHGYSGSYNYGSYTNQHPHSIQSQYPSLAHEPTITAPLHYSAYHRSSAQVSPAKCMKHGYPCDLKSCSLIKIFNFV
ncbi:hypothetical protein ATANTOWER_002399 [Ataeniobius toweri]|uniref:Growth hormone/erythropoietin receptor ligand binding domain-containing protein n=1 Tax=Ataeniobius toweri TaxID=208326 RepID=A0ABU7C037_9TELE|nr:hypothetical protein [Ataeniobius toweri]